MHSVKEILQHHRNRTLIPITAILFVIAMLSFVVNYPTLEIESIIKLNYLISGGLAIIALIVSFTFFYSGKMIDYKRDYIKRVTDLEEIVDKTRRWLNTIEIQNIHVDNCKHFVNQLYQYLQDPNKRISFTSKEVVVLSIVLMVLIIVSLEMINTPNLDLFDLIYAAIVFTTGIIYLVKLWFMYEDIIKVYNNDLITLNKFIGALKGIND